MRQRNNICARCLKARHQSQLTFTASFVPAIATCFYCRRMNQDGFYITEEDSRHAQERKPQDNQARQIKAIA